MESLSNENERFYNFIKQLTIYSETTKKIITPPVEQEKGESENMPFMLRSISDSILGSIICSYKTNIQLAASKGSHVAYLCLYERYAKYKGQIPFHDFIVMPDKLREKFLEYKITPVMEQLREILRPFQVEFSTLETRPEFANICLQDHEYIIIAVTW